MVFLPFFVKASSRIGWVVGGLFAVVFALAIVAFGLLLAGNTDPGQAFIGRAVWALSGGQVRISGITGHLPDDFRIGQIEIADVDGVWLAGGSFGRRANVGSDYIVEAVSIARAYGAEGTPIKLQWTREDDIRGGLYRPMYFHKLQAGLDDKGQLNGWHHVIVGQSIMAGGAFAGMIKDGVDPTSVEGASTIPYAIPNISVDLSTTKTGVPVLWWRVVGSSHTTYAVEAFIDEVAHAAGQDGFTFRRKLLEHQPRMKAVLELVADKAGWNTPLPPGRGRGIAVAEAFKTFVAQVAEVSVDKNGQVKVERVVCAVDCGTPINPDIIAAQMEGGIGFGLGAALYGAITLKDGRVEQDNFNSYRVLRMNEMPKVEVHIVPSSEPPTGVGEPGVAPLGPAVANAIFAATGKRNYVLPFSKS